MESYTPSTPCPVILPSPVDVAELLKLFGNLNPIWYIGGDIRRIHRNGAMYTIVLAMLEQKVLSARDLKFVIAKHCDDLPVEFLGQTARQVSVDRGQLIAAVRAKNERCANHLNRHLPQNFTLSGTMQDAVTILLEAVHESEVKKRSVAA